MKLPPLLLVAAAALLAAHLLLPPAYGAEPSPAAQTAAARPVVIELYTAQGCSSCPPADALLGQLAARGDVLALAFHVDYWDSIGWRDPFAIPESVRRQRRYVETLNLSTAYTPQAIIDGRASIIGSDQRRLTAAIGQRPENLPISLDIVGAVLLVSLAASTAREPYDVALVAYLPRASTAIRRGENAGRVLEEFNIVRQYRRLGAWHGERVQFSVPLTSLPKDAARVAVLVQRAGQGPINGAASMALP